MPVFSGWLRNLPDEGGQASWDAVRTLSLRAEETGWDLTLIAELNLNDIKGIEAPALDAWSSAAASTTTRRPSCSAGASSAATSCGSSSRCRSTPTTGGLATTW